MEAAVIGGGVKREPESSGGATSGGHAPVAGFAPTMVSSSWPALPAVGTPAKGVSPERSPCGAGALMIESEGSRKRAAGRSWNPRGGCLPKNITPTRGCSPRRRTPRTSV